MTKKGRYLLIATCVAAFLVLAPIVIFYVRGVTYDRQNKQYLNTGLLSVRSDPKGAKILLDDKETDITPADIRFLKPGGYNVKITKDGYREWTKRIDIASGKVTWASPGVEKITLFLQQPSTEAIAQGVVDFYKLPAGWLYLTDKNLFWTNNENGKNPKSFSLPKPVKKIAQTHDGKVFLLTGDQSALLFDLSSNLFTDVTSLLKGSINPVFDADGNIWLQKNGLLIEIDRFKLQQTVQAKNITTFYLLSNTPYFIQNDMLYYLSMSSNKWAAQSVGLVPKGKKSELVITDQKQIFVLTDGDLYRINSPNQKLQSGVTSWSYDASRGALLYTTTSELDFYNFITNQTQLISRSSDGFENAYLDSIRGYSLFQQKNKIIAAETDTFDHQNSYELLSSLGTAKFSLDQNLKRIFLLDKNELKSVTIR